MKDFSIKVTVRSARILAAVEKKFGTQTEMSRRTGLSTQHINVFVTMRVAPVGPNGWTEMAEKFASALGVYPSDIWPEHLREVRLKSATAEMSLDVAEVMAISGDSGPDVQLNMKLLIAEAARALTERELYVVTTRSDGATLEDLANEFGVGRERVRQIEARAHRKMRTGLRRIGVESYKGATV